MWSCARLRLWRSGRPSPSSAGIYDEAEYGRGSHCSPAPACFFAPASCYAANLLYHSHGTRGASGSGRDCHVLVNIELIFSLDQGNEAWELREMENRDRKDAFQAAKLAIRAYARDPSPENEAAVAEAFRRIRRLNGVDRWRKAACADCLQPVGSN